MQLLHPSFIDNKYYRLYVRLVSTNYSEFNGYTEAHHIIPRSFGGIDASDNIAKLPARVHYICHYLLTKFTTGKYLHKSAKAFNMMHARSRTNIDRYINSRLFAANRMNLAKASSVSQSGSGNSQYGSVWMTYEPLDITSKFKYELLEEAIAQGWVVGKKTTKFKSRMAELLLSRRAERPMQNKDQMLGLTLKIHKAGVVLFVKDIFYYRDYILDGWKVLGKNNRNSTHLKHRYEQVNMAVPNNVVDEFLDSGLWARGRHVPNHSVRGKRYQRINGERIFLK